MSVLLAADTSTAIYSVALCNDDRILAEAVIDGRRLHSERLLPAVAWLLGEAGLTLADIDLLAISIGPGSFTGLRIGAATWKGLAFANDLPLVGVPTLDAMTRLATPSHGSYHAVLLDARMKEVFAAVYQFDHDGRIKVLPDQACSIDQFIAQARELPDFDPGLLTLTGDGAQLYQDRLREAWPAAAIASPILSVPRASAVALEAISLRDAGVTTDAALVNPVYLRKSQAEVNREKKLATAAP